MNIYKKKRVTEMKDVVIKHICDKCRREFSWATHNKKYCGDVWAKLHVESDYLITKDIWQTYRDIELCRECYIEVMDCVNSNWIEPQGNKIIRRKIK